MPNEPTARTVPARAVVVGIDQSLESTAAAHWAAHEAAQRGCDLVLAHAYGLPLIPPAEPGAILVADRETGQALLQQVAGTLLVPASTRLEHVVEVAAPAELLSRLADQADLTVLGQDRPHLAGTMPFGRTTNAVASSAARPVVSVPRGWIAWVGDRRPIAVAVDGRHRSDSTLAFAFEEAALHRLPLLVLHAAPLDQLAFGDQDETLNLAELLAGWRADNPDIEVGTMLLDNPARESVADVSPQAQLLVVGRPRRGRRWSRWITSTARAVLRDAQCPVAVVPQDPPAS